jgi:hypothetical protein
MNTVIDVVPPVGCLQDADSAYGPMMPIGVAVPDAVPVAS